MSNPDDPYKFFDKIYCINLFTRDDRLERCKKLFKKLDIPVTFYEFINIRMVRKVVLILI